MYLIDTNIWLERLLDQERSDEVGQLLDHLAPERLFTTDFAFHSIGVVLSRLNRVSALLTFTQDTLIDGGVGLVRLDPADMHRLAQATEEFNLDFDDAYQYVAAEKYELVLISFDGDFDRSERGRKTPAEVLQSEG
jgi:predicted nucleic acid-binding protein